MKESFLQLTLWLVINLTNWLKKKKKNLTGENPFNRYVTIHIVSTCKPFDLIFYLSTYLSSRRKHLTRVWI